MEERVCRNCHESGGDLIAPCSCSGSMRWVHRDCLDKWRSVSQNPLSFTACDICGTKYHLRPKKIGAWPYIRTYLLIFLDILSVLAVITTVIVLCGLVVFGVERATNFSGYFANDSSYGRGNSTIADLLHNPVFLIFVGGLALLCFIIGCCYIMYSIIKCMCDCCNDCCTTTYTATTYDYNAWFPIWWWWYVTSPPPSCYCGCCCDCCDCCISCTDCMCNECYCDNCTGDCNCGDCNCGDCDCGDCNCSGGDSDGGGAGAALLIVLAIIVAIIICIGAIVGTFLVVSFIARMVSGHLAVLNRQKRAQALVVVDLSEEDNNKDLADAEDVVLLTPEEKNGGGSAAPPPAPSFSGNPGGAGVTYAPSNDPGTSGASVLVLPPSQPTVPSYGAQPTVPSYGAQPTVPSYGAQPVGYPAGPSAPSAPSEMDLLN